VKAVVTGAAGFIGSHLTDLLIAEGHKVLAVDALLPGHGDAARVNPQARFRKADIRAPGTRALLGGADWVFHAAAVSAVPWAVADPVTCADINMGGTVNLLEGARHAGVKRFVLASSAAANVPATAYGASKQAAENYCSVYAALYGLPAVSLRYSNVCGSLRQNPGAALMSMRASWLRDGYVQVTGDGEQSRDFIDVADVCRASLLAACSDVTGTVDICTGTSRTMNEVAGFFGCPVQYRPERPGDVRRIVQDPGPARELLGFAAQIPFTGSMKAYLERP
jgi:UDP-glucose 4-epimerase